MNRKIDIYEPDEIQKVINAMCMDHPILEVTEDEGISYITTNNIVLLDGQSPIALQAGQIVTIGAVNYEVLSVTTNSFAIEATGITADTWKLAVNFMFGSRIEINNLLTSYAKDENKKLIRFPLIWLFINNERVHNSASFDFQTTLQFAFVHLTKREYRAADRLTNVFKAVLQPLSKLFLETLHSTQFRGVFAFPNMINDYSDWYRYFYGSSDLNKQVLDAATDAIELSCDLTFVKQYGCDTTAGPTRAEYYYFENNVINEFE
jgi:hypothetical protein